MERFPLPVAFLNEDRLSTVAFFCPGDPRNSGKYATGRGGGGGGDTIFHHF
jgi:hypothetical protein